MKRPTTVTDILNSVEFELIQHTLSQGDVASGIQQLRTYQAKARGELFGQDRLPALGEVADVQFHANEMAATLLQVMHLRLEAMHQELQQATFLKQHQWVDRPPSERGEEALRSPSVAGWPVRMAPENLATSDSLDNALDALQKHPVAEIGMELQRSQIPLLGGMVNWLRRVLHELVLFYVNRAVRQQAESHELYGALLQQLTASQQAQAAEIAALRAQLQALTSRGSPPVGDLPAGDLPK